MYIIEPVIEPAIIEICSFTEENYIDSEIFINNIFKKKYFCIFDSDGK